MNGALYLSFFQGQLEAALEQVVQLAVQEISKTVGAGLGSMLLETASKEQENQRLRARLQAVQEPQRSRERTEESRAETQSSSLSLKLHTDTYRLEQKRRAVGQMKVVMEQVLDFAVCELSKIVEDSFDDLLLELNKTERENEDLKKNLRDTGDEDTEQREPKEPKEPKEPENQTDSPGSSEGTGAKEPTKEPTENTNGASLSVCPAESESDRQAVITVSQDWVPILDKVFGQKWCSDLWQIKEVDSKDECSALGSEELPEVLIQESLSPVSEKSTEIRPDPAQWLQGRDSEPVTTEAQCTSVSSSVGDEAQLKSPSMLHRLLTLPSQLLEENEESMEALPSLADPEEPQTGPRSAPGQSSEAPEQDRVQEEEEEEKKQQEEEEAEEESSRNKAGKKLHACKECGKKFHRSSLLKVHRQIHKDKQTSVPCPQCGKNFSHFPKLQAHLRTHSGKTT